MAVRLGMKAMLFTAAWCGLGGAVGAVVRLSAGAIVAATLGRGYLWLATLLVNVAGCGLLGWLVGRDATGGLLANRPLLAAGFCGALTTFSTFALEVVQVGQRRPGVAAGLVAAHLICGGAATWAGLTAARHGGPLP